MANETTYGVISDVHNDPTKVASAIHLLRWLGAQKFILNGDIGDRREKLQQSQDFVAQILEYAGKSGFEVFFQPGSHETIAAFDPVMKDMTDRYKSLRCALNERKVEEPDHHLVFLPGSDWVAGGEYMFGSDDRPTAAYAVLDDTFVLSTPEFERRAKVRGFDFKHVNYSNMYDLRRLVTVPEKTILVCHVPRRFSSIEHAVDMAYFAESRDGSVMEGRRVEEAIKEKFPQATTQEQINAICRQNGLTLKRENRGNVELAKLLEEIGIRRAVSGHFHESGHRAHDSKVNPVKEEELTDELFWNSGHFDAGQAGILTVKDGRVSYRNIRLQNYLRDFFR